MRRSAFIKKNQERWKRFEETSKDPSADPDEMADLFIRVSDDLAYANTHYPKSDTTQYLNTLASKVHHHIYRNKKEERSRIITFWTREVPQIFYEHRKEMLISFLVFFTAILIGAISAANDSEYVRLILGDAYVDMTLENIEKGEPMGVYGSQSSELMFFGITFNNISVSFRTFMWGGFMGSFPVFLLGSLGTGLILFMNGIMLGSFQFFFYEKGLLLESFLTIWIHGTIEIYSIVLAGMAGIVAGNHVLFPGTYKRSDSFAIGFKKGLKIIIGLIPFFIIAGFLESYVTRLFDLSPYLKGTIIIISAAFMVFYTIVYPRLLYKKGVFNTTDRHE